MTSARDCERVIKILVSRTPVISLVCYALVFAPMTTAAESLYPSYATALISRTAQDLTADRALGFGDVQSRLVQKAGAVGSPFV